MSAPRLRDAGDSALVLELEPSIDAAVNARAIGIGEALKRERIAGIRDIVPTYRSVAVYFDPLVIDVEVVQGAMERAQDTPAEISVGRTIEVPVEYGGEYGPDIEEVAARTGLLARDVAERHAAREYRVFMLGFLPGFAYMGSVDPTLAVPRRATPRVTIPAGSVGIAGLQTGVYPLEYPGGWQIIGRTPIHVFDPARTPAALFAPGDRVRFVPSGAGGAGLRFAKVLPRPISADETRPSPDRTGSTPHVTVLSPGLFTTVQDSGRWGHQADGVPVSGAMDMAAHRLANALVGNDPSAATLEATLVGPELRLEAEVTVAVAGADLGATLGRSTLPLHQAARCVPGSVIRFGGRRSGARAYIAFSGGVEVPVVLGSRATHVRSSLGGLDGRPLRAGDTLLLGTLLRSPSASFGGASPHTSPSASFGGQAFASHHRLRTSETPRVGAGGARVRVLLGPQDEGFAPEAIRMLLETRFAVSSLSDRMGYRLTGGAIPRVPDRDMISDATFTGALQVPPSGEPILLMADRQTTGGYPQIATMITADLPLAAQLAPGDWIEFERCTRSDAIAALREQVARVG